MPHRSRGCRKRYVIIAVETLKALAHRRLAHFSTLTNPEWMSHFDNPKKKCISFFRSTTITDSELQNFEQIDDYNTSASPFFNQTEGFDRLVSQLDACNISFFV